MLVRLRRRIAAGVGFASRRIRRGAGHAAGRTRRIVPGLLARCIGALVILGIPALIIGGAPAIILKQPSAIIFGVVPVIAGLIGLGFWWVMGLLIAIFLKKGRAYARSTLRGVDTFLLAAGKKKIVWISFLAVLSIFMLAAS